MLQILICFMQHKPLAIQHKPFIKLQPFKHSLQTCCHPLCSLSPTGSQEAAVILRVWKQSMQPLLAALQAWLYDGLLQGSPHNFFICEGESKLHCIALQCCKVVTVRGHLSYKCMP